MKRLALLIFFLFFLFPQNVFASPVINEFSSADSSDWVEIYNPDEMAIDLSQFRLRDLTQTNKIDLSGSIEPKGFAVFDWNTKLNNSGDLIRLVLAVDDSIVDQVSYGDQGGISAPIEGQTGGRKTDNAVDWVILTTSSKGVSNNSSSVFLSPSLTPTNLPTPTKTLTPSKTPTPVKTASPTKILTSNPTSIPTISPKATLKSVKSASTSPTKENSIKSDNIYNSISPSPAVKQLVSVMGDSSSSKSKLFLIITLSVGGILFIIAAGILIKKYRSEILQWINS